MQQIHCLIIGKDRSITERRVDASKINFTHNEGLYTIPRESVNIAKFVETGKKKVDPYPELIYLEGNALPVNNSGDNVQEFLENLVLANALNQVAAAQSDFFGVIMDYVKHPSKALLGVFVLIIAGAVIWGFLFP